MKNLQAWFIKKISWKCLLQKICRQNLFRKNSPGRTSCSIRWLILRPPNLRSCFSYQFVRFVRVNRIICISFLGHLLLYYTFKSQKTHNFDHTKIRRQLSKAAGGRSILPRVDKLRYFIVQDTQTIKYQKHLQNFRLDPDLKKVLKFESAHSRRKEDIMRLHRLQEETTV